MNSSSFDDDLRRAIRRVHPSAGFADRVMARVPEKRWPSRRWLGAVAAGIAVLASLGGVQQLRREHRAHAQQIQREVFFALSLASAKLDHAMSNANSRLQRSAPDVTIGVEEKDRL
jgi:hypothetical protein